MRRPSFVSRVRSRLNDMHPAERRLGELICDFPGDMASYSASELADLAGVSNATVTRFVRQLGYKSYSEAKRHAREESRTGSRLFLEHTRADHGDEWFEATVAQSRSNLDTTMHSVGRDQIDAAARAMLAARKVWVVGFRTNQSFATYLQWQASQVIENIVSIPGGGQTMGEHLVNMGPGDLVVVFGLRRRIANFAAILDVIEGTGADLLYITDESARFRATAKWHFRCHTETPGALFDHVSVMAVCYAIVSRVIDSSGSAGRARLREIESFHDRLSEL